MINCEKQIMNERTQTIEKQVRATKSPFIGNQKLNKLKFPKLKELICLLTLFKSRGGQSIAHGLNPAVPGLLSSPLNRLLTQSTYMLHIKKC